MSLGIPCIPLSGVPAVTELLDLAAKKLGRAVDLLYSPSFLEFAEQHGTPQELRRLKRLGMVRDCKNAFMLLASMGGGAFKLRTKVEVAEQFFEDQMRDRSVVPYAGPWGT